MGEQRYGHTRHVFQLRYIVLAVVGVFLPAFFSSGTIFGAEKETTAPSSKSTIPSEVIRASELINRDVENDQGEVIAEIEEAVINEKGCVYHVILSIGELFGIPDKQVAVSFDSLILKKEWKYRIRYKDDGTKERNPWRLNWIFVYPGDVEELRNKPAYHDLYGYPRGSAAGWGIYSYPVERARE